MQREKRWFLQTVSHCGILPRPMVWTIMLPIPAARMRPSHRRHGAFLIDKVRAENIPVVFTIELSNGKLARHDLRGHGHEKLEFATCHNVTAQAFADGATYLQLMERNVQALREALN